MLFVEWRGQNVLSVNAQPFLLQLGTPKVKQHHAHLNLGWVTVNIKL